MKDRTIRKIALCGILAAAIVLLTMLVSIPIPGGLGFVNLGDAGVLSAEFLLGGPWGALTGGAASALADLLLGYAVYMPATFVIKGGMALLFCLLQKVMKPRLQVLAFFISALLVPFGYFLYETILYGGAAALPNVPFNLVQCLVGAAVAFAATRLFRNRSIGGLQ